MSEEDCPRCGTTIGAMCHVCLSRRLAAAFDAGVMAGAHKCASDTMRENTDKDRGVMSITIPDGYAESVFNPFDI